MPEPARRTRALASWRPLPSTASLRPVFAAKAVDEAPLRALALEGLRTQEQRMQQLLRTKPHHEALQSCCEEFNATMQQTCMSLLERSDLSLIRLARAGGRAGLRALWVAGVVPPTSAAEAGPDQPEALAAVAAALDESRPQREFDLRARVVRTATADSYAKRTTAPAALAMPGLEHVLGAAEVARLRAGEALVLDPQPPLLSPAALAMVQEDLAALAASGVVMVSANPCNVGAGHGMLPMCERGGGGDGLPLRAATRTLLRQLAALPALVAAHGWPRPLAVPPMAQLGHYPGDGTTAYLPHLDRQPHEEQNRRELTFLIYVNREWDAARDGGCLRLHAPEPALGGGAAHRDVAPVGGRIVVFPSGQQWHEVLPCRGRERLALTLWVEHAAT